MQANLLSPVAQARHRYGAGAASTLPPLPPTPDMGEYPQERAADGRVDAAGARQVGKYLVSPLIHVLENGWIACSVSIRSGRGSATTDRVLRMTRLFRSLQDAAAYAHAEGLQWISNARRPLAA